MAKPPKRQRPTPAAKTAGKEAPSPARRAGDEKLFLRIAAALERLAPPAEEITDFSAAEAFVWYPEGANPLCRPAHQSRRDVPP